LQRSLLAPNASDAVQGQMTLQLQASK
jgi:hypothetical protein